MNLPGAANSCLHKHTVLFVPACISFCILRKLMLVIQVISEVQINKILEKEMTLIRKNYPEIGGRGFEAQQRGFESKAQ